MASDTVIIRELADFTQINTAIIEQFNLYKDTDEVRRSHYFAGRYENIYLDVAKVPAMQTVMRQGQLFAQQILKTNQALKQGFWFNLMLPGQVTQPHTHDDDDERLSAVYYIDAHENSGDLLLTVENDVIQVKPEAGKFVFFPPTIRHEVTENKSSNERLSVGINFGLEIDDE